MKDWKQLLVKTISICGLVLHTACGTTNIYECQLIAKGSKPSSTTYYVVPADSSLLPTPEFMEYADYLRHYLNLNDYVESNAANATLRIEFEYTLGNPISRKTTVTTTEYGQPGIPGVPPQPSANAVKVSSKGLTLNIDNPEATFAALQQKQLESKSGIKNNEKKAAPPVAPLPTRTTYVTDESSVIPLRVVIRAFDNNTHKLVWRVLAKDELEDTDDIHLVMPWLLVCAVENAGENSNGESTVTLKDKPDVRATYGLIWPY
jgi:hypothetical protein